MKDYLKILFSWRWLGRVDVLGRMLGHLRTGDSFEITWMRQSTASIQRPSLQWTSYWASCVHRKSLRR